MGIWAFGIMAYTLFLRMAVPILQGKLSKTNESVALHKLVLPEETETAAALKGI